MIMNDILAEMEKAKELANEAMAVEGVMHSLIEDLERISTKYSDKIVRVVKQITALEEEKDFLTTALKENNSKIADFKRVIEKHNQQPTIEQNN